MTEDIAKKYFIGRSSNEGLWASVYTYKPNNPEVRLQKGEIFATVSLNAPDGFSTSTAGNLLLDFLHEKYFESKKVEALTSLEEAVISTGKHLKKLMQNDEKAAGGVELDLLTAVIKGNIVYAVNTGEGQLYVFRDGNLTKVSRYFIDPIGDGLIKSASFVAKPADVFILTTPRAVEELDTDELIDLAVEFSELKLKQKEFDDESGVALMLVGFGVDRIESREERKLHSTIVEEVNKELTKITEPAPVEAEEIEEVEEIAEEMPPHEKLMDDDLPEEEMDIVEEYETDEEFIEGTKVSFLENVKNRLALASNSLRNKWEERKRRKVLESRAEKIAPRVETQETNLEELGNTSNDKTYKVILTNIAEKSKMLGLKAKVLFWDKFLGMGGDGVYVKGSMHRGKKNIRFIAFVAIVLIALLYFSITSILNGIEARKLKREAEVHLLQAETLISEVEDLAEVKANADNTDLGKIELYNKLKEAGSELDKVEGVEEFAGRYEQSLEKIADLTDILNRVIKVASPQLVIDFAASNPGAEVSDIAIGGGKIYAADKRYGKIYSVDYSGANPIEVATGLQNPKSITVDDDGNIVFLDENGDMRLGTVTVADGSVKRHAGTSQFRVGNVSAIEFVDISGGRIYGVDQSAKQVIFLQRAGSDYSIPQSRFSIEELSTGVDLSINDLKIYVLADVKQGMYRFFNEVDDTPVMKGLAANENLYQSTGMFVDDIYIFITDSTNKRLLVFEKGVTEMNLLGQYVYSGSESIFSNLSEVVADRQNNAVFVLDGSKIYRLNLAEIG